MTDTTKRPKAPPALASKRCKGCRAPMTWAATRVQWGRLVGAGATPSEAREHMPLCQKCVTGFLVLVRDGPRTTADHEPLNHHGEPMRSRTPPTRKAADQQRFDELLRNLPISDRTAPLPRTRPKLGKVKGGKLVRLEQR